VEGMGGCPGGVDCCAKVEVATKKKTSASIQQPRDDFMHLPPSFE
jgi:hypothetical protein